MVFFRISFDPDGFMSPLAGPGPLPLLDRKTDERDSKSVHSFLISIRPFPERLIQDVVVCPPQAATNNLLRKKWRDKRSQAKNVSNCLHIPTLTQHINTDNA